ncbi:retinol dehydrogenase [Acrasis kona]|uniref:Retinol dehydrogenase n=1 Tax=Acrasis kona TaxID=1008807 RepID=A0AAW2YUT0_9EUKA
MVKLVAESLLKNPELLRGKVAIITGANSGIGEATAKAMNACGAHIIMACRSEEKAKAAVDRIQEHYKTNVSNDNQPPVEFMKLDLSQLESVREFVTAFESKNLQINYLINNAGCVFMDHGVTKDGYEQFFQVNYLSHFLLTRLLLENLKANNARILNLSSGAHKFPKRDKLPTEEELRTPMEKDYKMVLYGLSKLYMLLFTIELQKKLQGTGVTTFSIDPGYVKSELGQKDDTPGWMKLMTKPFELMFSKNVFQGAQTSLHCALMPLEELTPGEHYENCGITAKSKMATNEELQAELYRMTCKFLEIEQ